MKKQNDKIIRSKYIRVLEKFVKQTISLLKHPEFDFEIFKKQTIKNYYLLEQVNTIRLDSAYLKKLELYSHLIINYINTTDKDFTIKHQLLLKEANLLHKEKNNLNYKKDKHKNKKFNDGY